MDRRENIIEVVCQLIARASNLKVMLCWKDLLYVSLALVNAMVLFGVIFNPIVGQAGILFGATLPVYIYKSTIPLADALQALSPDQTRRFVSFIEGSLKGMRFDDVISTCNDLTRDPETIPRLLQNMTDFVKKENNLIYDLYFMQLSLLTG